MTIKYTNNNFFFRSVAENAAEGFSVTDESGKVITWNNAMENLTGLSASEIVGKYAWDVQSMLISEREFTENDKESIRKGISELLATGKSPFAGRLMELLYKRTDGTEIFIESHIIPIETDKGFILVSTANDITERKRNEEEIKQQNEDLELKVLQCTTHLQAANKELEAFSYSVSHDLRAPLRSIDGFSQALFEDYFHLLDDQGKDYLKRIRSSVDMMSQMIGAMINLTRVNRVQINLEKVDISAMARSIVEEIRKTDQQRQVEFDIEPGLTDQADFALIKVVLQNIFENAWKFTSFQSITRIKFSSTKISGGKAYFIRDNGVGFNMEYATKLFAPFQRMHQTTEFPGAGMGLAIVQRIVHRHNGKIWVESKENEGTTFYFTLFT